MIMITVSMHPHSNSKFLFPRCYQTFCSSSTGLQYHVIRHILPVKLNRFSSGVSLIVKMKKRKSVTATLTYLYIQQKEPQPQRLYSPRNGYPTA